LRVHAPQGGPGTAPAPPLCGPARISPAPPAMSVANPSNATSRRRALSRPDRAAPVPEDVRTAYTYKLKPTPEQECQLADVVWRCRTLYTTALDQRITAYRRCGATLTCSQQQAESPDLKAAFPEDAASHSPVLQDVGCLDAPR